MLRVARFMLALASAGTLVACGDDDGGMPPMDGGPDGGADARVDAGPPESIEEVPLQQEVQLEGMSAPVEVVQDNRGMWHFYGEQMTDLMRAEGYMMARDRMGQMEFLRRLANGELAAFAGSVDDSLIQDDIMARFAGHRRNAERIIDELGAENRALLEAFAAGVTAYIQALRDGDEQQPPAVSAILPVNFLDDWTVLDTLAIARLQTAQLSFDPNDDIGMTRALAAFRQAFPSDASEQPIQARAGAFHDFYPFVPSRRTYVREGFPNLGEDTGTRALIPPGPTEPTSAMELPSPRVLQGAHRFTRKLENHFARYFGPDRLRGSNSWIVHGSKTESGNPLMASDPHLSLTSPPLFWYTHLNTKRAGGEFNVQGLALAGTPAVLLGYNDDIAWGLTTHGYDVTDAYREEIIPGGEGEPDKVMFQGEEVALETITEEIQLDNGSSMTVEFERVPHHGLIVPDSRTETEAISIKWTGNEPTNEVGAVLDLARSTSVTEARDSLDKWGVGGQNFMIADSSGDIFWTSQVDLPVRPPEALTYDPSTQMGAAPAFVLDGTGPHEWQGNLSDRFIPHQLNPERGFVVTANNDAVGVTDDGNPFDAAHYIGWTFSEGHRAFRITERLQEATSDNAATVDDMKSIQNDAQSPYGRLARDAFVAELDRAEQWMDDPSSHPDLDAAMGELSESERSRLIAARDRLEQWSFDTPAAVEGEPSEQEIADSVATSIFNAAFGRVGRQLLSDEFDRLGRGARHDSRLIIWALTEPERLESYDEGLGDTVLWDDLGTPDVQETRGDRVIRGMAAALEWLASELGGDMNEWRWGKLHTLRMESIVPALGDNPISIPPGGSSMFPDGFPRHGDRDTVDVAGFSDLATEDFSYGSGPVQRLVVEMTPDGPRAFNALPGGQSIDPNSPHHADEAELWRNNEAPPMHFDEDAVVENAERRFQFSQP